MPEIAVAGENNIMRTLGSFTESILGSVAHKEFGLSWGLENELRRLKKTLEKIAPVTDDAENRQETEEVVRVWLRKLKDAAYDVDDVLDEFSYEAMRPQEKGVGKDELGEIKTFKMHGLVHDLALSVVSKAEVTILDASEMENNISGKDTSEIFSADVQDAKKLRSFFSLENNFLPVNTLSIHKRLRVACLLGVRPLKSQYFASDFKHLRYLDLSYSNIKVLHNVSIRKLYNLQTLVLYRCTNVHIILQDIGFLKLLEHLNLSYSDIHDLPKSINQLRNLQTLDLFRCLQFETLPDLDIGSFRHLSRLDISYTPISKLPLWLSSTISLRDFRFMFCRNLKALPEDLGALTLLRSLNLNGTRIKVLPEACVSTLRNLEIVELGSECGLPKEIEHWPKLRRLTHRGRSYHEMPKGIERLICLEELKSYMVGKEEVPTTNHHSRIQDLSSLNDLKVLVIKNLENVGGIEDAARAELKDKQNIQLLELRWDGEGIDDSSKVLEGLQPHPNLKTLLIKGFSGMELPNWMGGFDSSPSYLPNLVELKLRNCNSCEQLPPMGLLPCLRVLHIDGMNSVKCLGEEFYHQISPSSSPTSFTVTVFPSLIELKLSDMSSLEEWLAPPPPYSANSFPSLRRLIISGCFQLRSTPLTSFSSLDSLELSNTNDKVVGSILAIEGGGGKGKGPGSLITSISIQDSAQLNFFPLGVLQYYIHLQSLEISCCSKFQGFRIQNYNNSDDDDIRSDVVFNYTGINSLHSLKLRNCPSLTYLQDLREWKSLTKLWIENCDKLKKSFTYDLASLPSLRTLYVDRFIDLSASTPAASTSHASDTLVSLTECKIAVLPLKKSRTLSKKRSRTENKIKRSIFRAGSRSKSWFRRGSARVFSKFTRSKSIPYEKLKFWRG
ncbi:putative disease resistance protein RGA4 isoform X2 [Papaver somniferum]|uniref:putative disease resistance protein RGA4 isoform X2 n=1 Tax=Papaver somniferum TaxID=3469 RepID=UPI000E7046B0|nr:putative disease resistance protein RGA4 isoform X2 [Papaver somniferum]